MLEINNFVQKLSLEKVSTNSRNLYQGNTVASQIRKENLQLYLTKMKRLRPKILLLGEAPGYKGCGITGIAFSSERLLHENNFFKDQGFRCFNERDCLESEISATIVWKELDQISAKPLIWNIYPFHPHAPENFRTNRTPTRDELIKGKIFLKELLKMFDIQQIVALGRKPESQLIDLGFSYTYLRHPANGGKRKFVDGLRPILNNPF